MKFLKIGLLCCALSACAGMRQEPLTACLRDVSFQRGVKEALAERTLDTSFVKSCSPASRVDALAAYRDGFESVRAEKKVAPVEEAKNDAPLVMPSANLREPSSSSWVCEVEANSKIFTGIGPSREEAIGSARTNCGAHVQASYCTKAECKQNL